MDCPNIIYQVININKYFFSIPSNLILSELKQFIFPLEYVPTDPVKLSYWFVQNFQLRHDERLKILKLNTAFERLRLEYRYLYMVLT